jgi:hypothetical protein
MNSTPQEEVKAPTRGPWIVTTVPAIIGRQIAVISDSEAASQQVICVIGDEFAPNANEHIANAALIAAAPDMLDALIAIQEQLLDPGTDEVDLNAVNELISDIFAKLANEAGEEL